MNSHFHKAFASAVTIIVVLGLCSVCVAGPRGYVKRTILRLSQILEIEKPEKRTAKLVSELHRTFDYNQFEEKVLQDASAKFSAAQKKRFSKAFKKMFENKILALADDTSLQCHKYDVSNGKHKLEILVTCIQKKQPSAADAVVLHFSSQNKNKITDLTFSGALLSRNYRGIINKILRRDGADALIAKIENKSSGSLTEKSLL